MANTFNFESADCERAMNLQTLALLHEPLSPRDLEFLSQHLSQCATCCELKTAIANTSDSLQSTLSAVSVSPGFAARTLAALPQAPVQPRPVPNKPAAPQVFTAMPQRRSFPWGVAGAAAVLALAAAAAFFAAPQNRPSILAPDGAVSVRRGMLVDADGKSVSSVKPGAVYHVQEDAVLPLSTHSTVKVQAGAEFAIQLAANAEPELNLKAGDLYAWGREDGKTTRVNCTNFHTLLRTGDFYVAEESGEESAGVVIVFNGRADVTQDDETLPIRAGQIFLRLGTDEIAFSQVIEMTEAVVHIAENTSPAPRNKAALRKEYEMRVIGYREELAALKQYVQTEQDAHRVAELRERYQRVTAYLEAHTRKLESLKRNKPFEKIKRGLNGHSDPSTWL